MIEFNEKDILARIEQLRTLPVFEKLRNFKPPFNPYKVLGVDTRELSHSNLLAYLFDPAADHDQGLAFLSAFLQQAEIDPKLSELLCSDKSINIEREYHYELKEHGRNFIDLLLYSRKSKCVLAIENKLFADEGNEQINRYQKILKERFPHYQKRAILFLTPSGYESSTAGHEHDEVPCFTTGYVAVKDSILSQIENISDSSNVRSKAELVAFLNSTVNHIKEDILMTNEHLDEIKGLWAKAEYNDMFTAICKSRPSLDDCYESFKQSLCEFLNGQNIKWKEIPTKKSNGHLVFVRFSLEEWNGQALPIRLYFRWYPDWKGHESPEVAFWVLNDEFNKNIEVFETLAEKCPDVIRSTFPWIGDDWGRCVLDGDRFYICNALQSPDDIAAEASAQAIDMIKRFLSCIEEAF
ncbi:MAG: PD-(D/E)XK nuclease family protein [Sedimenticola sp.]